MKTIGIITIHRINNYGSVLQAYALQQKLIDLDCKVTIIDYLFPNSYHRKVSLGQINRNKKNLTKKIKELFVKLTYSKSLYMQHKKIYQFVLRYLNLSISTYTSPDEIKSNPPIYDIYVTGSDQVWNPKYCYGDSTFFLDFAPLNKRRVAYSASFGVSEIDGSYYHDFISFLNKYHSLSVREKSGQVLVNKLIGRQIDKVLDPTLLLAIDEWNKIATPKRLIKEKYVLCYFLNYSFDAFPYADDLAQYVHKVTGYKIVCVARPPQKMYNNGISFKVDASPEDFLSLVRDSEIILTTSFHGTAFAINYSRPLYSIVEDRNSSDSRQVDLLTELGLTSRILSIKDAFPPIENFACDYKEAKIQLSRLRDYSLNYLRKSINHE